MKLKIKTLTIGDCYECPHSQSDNFARIVCEKTGSVVGTFNDDLFPIPDDCPLPDVEANP
jgi:hypothetical protein